MYMRKFKKIYVFKLNYLLIFFTLVTLLILSSFCFYTNVKANEESYISVPIIMYHSILKDSSRSGKYVITPSLLEKDFIYIKNRGYSAITMTQLIDYVYNDAPLPENPIIITFDDGYYNNLEYVIPLLSKYDMKAVISIVGDYTESYSLTDEANPNYSYLRWKDISSLMNTGLVEFQNHTYNLHSNSKR